MQKFVSVKNNTQFYIFGVIFLYFIIRKDHFQNAINTFLYLSCGVDS